MPSGLLHDANVRFYHPVDDSTEYTKDVSWDIISGEFASSILTSGLQASTGNTAVRLEDTVSPNYNDLASASGFTIAVWTSGFFVNNGASKEIRIGFANSSKIYRNAIILYKDSPTVRVNVTIEGTTSNKDWTPAPAFDDNWHLIIADARYETTGWRHRVSLDGSGWVDLGIDSQTGVPGTDQWTHVLTTKQSSASKLLIDEIVVWGDNDLFTTQELSNLYSLYNTYSTTMNQYGSTFGTPITDSTNCFIQGYLPTSENISLYIPGQKEIKSVDLFSQGSIQTSGNIDLYVSGTPPISSSSIGLYIHVPTPTSGDIGLYTTGPLSSSNSLDHFISSHQVSSNNIEEYIQGFQQSSGNADLYISGIPGISFPINLYIAGPIPISGEIDNLITGHLPASGNFSLFITGRSQDVDAFVAVVANNPSNNAPLFIHSVPSGETTTFHINSEATLFISDNGDDITVDSSWPSFVRIADPILIAHSGIWSSFVKGGNTASGIADLYLYGHASGSAPHGTLITDSFTTFINGQATQTGDEGLLSNGYFAMSSEVSSFAKVHLGLNNTCNFYVSGVIPITPPSAISDLFILGILDTTSGSHILHINSKESTDNTHTLFIFGIQDVISGNQSLYLKVTNIGLFDRECTLYAHGF